MPSVETSQIANLAQGATPVQIVILVLLGIVAAGVWFAVVKWYVDATNRARDQKIDDLNNAVSSIAKDIKAINDNLSKNYHAISKVESKLWSEEKITQAVKGALLEHQVKCDAWKYHCNERPPTSSKSKKG